MPSRQVSTLIVLGSGVTRSMDAELPQYALLFATPAATCEQPCADDLLGDHLCRLAKQAATLPRCSRSLLTWTSSAIFLAAM